MLKRILFIVFLVIFLTAAGLLAYPFWEAQQARQGIAALQEIKRQSAGQAETALPEASTTAPSAGQTGTPPSAAPLAEQTEAPPSADVAEAPLSIEPIMLPEYVELFAQNPDIAGWISISGTGIDYPVMRRDEYYMDRDFEGNPSRAGLPFMDVRSKTLPGANIIIYGHNMRDGSLFHDLRYYSDPEYLEEHALIAFDTLYERREYRIFAALELPLDNGMDIYALIDTWDAEQLILLNGVLEGEPVLEGEDIMMLSTCSYHARDGRFVVLARRV